MADRHVIPWLLVDRIRRGITSLEVDGDDDDCSSNSSKAEEASATIETERTASIASATSSASVDAAECVLVREDGVKLNCDSISFELSTARAAFPLFDAVLPINPNSLLQIGSSASCCIMRDSSARSSSVGVCAALLCARAASKNGPDDDDSHVEVCGLAVRSAYRGFKCVAANLISYAVMQNVLKPDDKVIVHVQADNTSALRFYMATMGMKPSVSDSALQPSAKRSRDDESGSGEMKKLITNSAQALSEFHVSVEQLKACFVADYYPPRPRCKFGSRHAFVLETKVPACKEAAVRLPWSIKFSETDADVADD